MDQIGDKGNRDWRFLITERGNLQLQSILQGQWYLQQSYKQEDDFVKPYLYQLSPYVPNQGIAGTVHDATLQVVPLQPINIKLVNITFFTSSENQRIYGIQLEYENENQVVTYKNVPDDDTIQNLQTNPLMIKVKINTGYNKFITSLLVSTITGDNGMNVFGFKTDLDTEAVNPSVDIGTNQQVLQSSGHIELIGFKFLFNQAYLVNVQVQYAYLTTQASWQGISPYFISDKINTGEQVDDQIIAYSDQLLTQVEILKSVDGHINQIITSLNGVRTEGIHHEYLSITQINITPQITIQHITAGFTIHDKLIFLYIQMSTGNTFIITDNNYVPKDVSDIRVLTDLTQLIKVIEFHQLGQETSTEDFALVTHTQQWDSNQKYYTEIQDSSDIINYHQYLHYFNTNPQVLKKILIHYDQSQIQSFDFMYSDSLTSENRVTVGQHLTQYLSFIFNFDNQQVITQVEYIVCNTQLIGVKILAIDIDQVEHIHELYVEQQYSNCKYYKYIVQDENVQYLDLFNNEVYSLQAGDFDTLSSKQIFEEQVNLIIPVFNDTFKLHQSYLTSINDLKAIQNLATQLDSIRVYSEFNRVVGIEHVFDNALPILYGRKINSSQAPLPFVEYDNLLTNMLIVVVFDSDNVIIDIQLIPSTDTVADLDLNKKYVKFRITNRAILQQLVPLIQDDKFLDVCGIIHTNNDNTQFTNYNWSDYVDNDVIYGFSRNIYVTDFDNKESIFIDTNDVDYSSYVTVIDKFQCSQKTILNESGYPINLITIIQENDKLTITNHTITDLQGTTLILPQLQKSKFAIQVDDELFFVERNGFLPQFDFNTNSFVKYESPINPDAEQQVFNYFINHYDYLRIHNLFDGSLLGKYIVSSSSVNSTQPFVNKQIISKPIYVNSELALPDSDKILANKIAEGILNFNLPFKIKSAVLTVQKTGLYNANFTQIEFTDYYSGRKVQISLDHPVMQGAQISQEFVEIVDDSLDPTDVQQVVGLIIATGLNQQAIVGIGFIINRQIQGGPNQIYVEFIQNQSVYQSDVSAIQLMKDTVDPTKYGQLVGFYQVAQDDVVTSDTLNLAQLFGTMFTPHDNASYINVGYSVQFYQQLQMFQSTDPDTNPLNENTYTKNSTLMEMLSQSDQLQMDDDEGLLQSLIVEYDGTEYTNICLQYYNSGVVLTKSYNFSSFVNDGSITIYHRESNLTEFDHFGSDNKTRAAGTSTIDFKRDATSKKLKVELLWEDPDVIIQLEDKVSSRLLQLKFFNDDIDGDTLQLVKDVNEMGLQFESVVVNSVTKLASCQLEFLSK